MNTPSSPIVLQRVTRLDTGEQVTVSQDLLRWGVDARSILLHYGMTRKESDRRPQDVPYFRPKPGAVWCVRVQFTESVPAPPPAPPPAPGASIAELRRQLFLVRVRQECVQGGAA
jgi:hypothetical protein